MGLTERGGRVNIMFLQINSETAYSNSCCYFTLWDYRPDVQ